jgi:hypothetical protein
VPKPRRGRYPDQLVAAFVARKVFATKQQDAAMLTADDGLLPAVPSSAARIERTSRRAYVRFERHRDRTLGAPH